jgi:hypothetical protein
MPNPPNTHAATRLHDAFRALSVASAELQLGDRALAVGKQSARDRDITQRIRIADNRIKRAVMALREIEPGIADARRPE